MIFWASFFGHFVHFFLHWSTFSQGLVEPLVGSYTCTHVCVCAVDSQREHERMIKKARKKEMREGRGREKVNEAEKEVGVERKREKEGERGRET